MAEARPLISHFGLKHQQELSHVRIWSNDLLLLAVSGTGKVASATATASIGTQYGRDIQAAVNLGLAGSTGNGKLGDLHLIHSIRDRHSDKSFYPDMLFRSDLPETKLTTYDHLVTKNDIENNKQTGLVDMEASGFYEAALAHWPGSRISCLKIISDFLDDAKLDKDKASNLIAENIPEIEIYLHNLQKFIADNSKQKFSPDEKKLLENVADNLNLTVTQQRQLEKSALYKKLTSADLKSILVKHTHITVNSKQERDQQFAKLRDILI